MKDDDLEPDEELGPPEGRIDTTGPAPLVVAGAVAMVLGWGLRGACLRFGWNEPDVSLRSVGVLVFGAALVGGSAYLTWRTVRRDRFALAHHQAVNRLVLGKATALVGAFLVGGYLGYAVSQLGVDNPAAAGRLWRSGLAALAAAAVTAAALLLELACRVPRNKD